MPKKTENELANRLRELRTANNMTQQELADLVDVSRQTIIAIEKGQYNPTTVLALKLARVFATAVEKIFWLNEDK